jgi:glutathione peroxidase-family protein
MKENRRLVASNRGDEPLPVLEFPKTIFSMKKPKTKKKNKAITGTKMDNFFKMRTESERKGRKYYRKGHIHSVISE